MYFKSKRTDSSKFPDNKMLSIFREICRKSEYRWPSLIADFLSTNSLIHVGKIIEMAIFLLKLAFYLRNNEGNLYVVVLVYTFGGYFFLLWSYETWNICDVIFRSIRAAEERAQLVLSQRKLRIASEVRERRQRHEEARQKVRQIDESLESQKLKNLVEKKSKIEKWSEERNLAMEKSRQLAQKTAELRQAIK